VPSAQDGWQCPPEESGSWKKQIPDFPAGGWGHGDGNFLQEQVPTPEKAEPPEQSEAELQPTAVEFEDGVQVAVAKAGIGATALAISGTAIAAPPTVAVRRSIWRRETVKTSESAASFSSPCS